MVRKRTHNSLCLVIPLFLITIVLNGCQVQWVSPYNTDLQKTATDMLKDVVAWESHMRGAAGTAAADPRSPDVQAKLDAWRGNIEAMSEIEIGIDPGSTVCDKFLAAISNMSSAVINAKWKNIPSAPAAASSDGKVFRHCETLPDIFTLMMQQVGDNTDSKPQVGDGAQKKAPESATIPLVLNQQCKLSWLSDEYFASLKEGRATAGAPSPARPAPGGAPPPTGDEQEKVTKKCRAVFEPPAGSVHGDLLSPLIVMLDAIIYREGRQAPSASK